jgi:hypothetical protein
VPSVSSEENDRIQPGKKVKDSAWVAAIVSAAPARPAAFSAARRICCRSLTRPAARSRKTSPAAFSTTPCDARTTSGVPTQSSSARMRRLKAGWVTCRASAAREKFRCSASARKSSSQFNSMADAERA